MNRDFLRWGTLPPLPDREGFAGMFAGVSGDALIAAGGANFPDGPPWEGGRKTWHDAVFVLESPAAAWRKAETRLPRTLGYGVSGTYGDRLIIAGGESGPAGPGGTPTVRAEVLALRWVGGRVEIEELPPLPTPAAHCCGTVLGSVLYVAGGVASADATAALGTFWALDLSVPRERMAWVELPAWPGPPRMQAVAAVQGGEFFLFGGIGMTADAEGKPKRVEPYLRDAYRYTPGSDGTPGTWRRIADMPAARAAAPGPAMATGAAHIVLFGGTAEADQHLDRPTHPGFSRDVLIYHAVTDTWVVRPGATPEGSPRVTAPTVAWAGGTVIVGGERSPGRRSPAVYLVSAEPGKREFGWANYAALAAYLAGMVWLGWGFSGRSNSTDDYFRGGQRVPWWAAGLSIFATMLSSVTFMAVPAAAFVDGWRTFLANSYLLITPLVAWVYLPFYRRLNVTSAYEYLELRFNAPARLLGSLLFMAYQGGRIAVVLLLPALALATVTDLDVSACIALMGVISIVYTVVGGIEAVIWTDAVQAVVLVGGALLSLLLLLGHIDGGAAAMFATVQAEGRFFGTVDWTLDWRLVAASGWVIMLGSIFNNLLPYTAGQDVVQRYVTTPDAKAAERAIWTNAAVSLPANALFFLIGSALLAFYKARPERLDPTMANDAVFPLFIVRELPPGVAGFVIAGIFAAAQSTIASSLNSIATCYVTDFHRRLFPRADDRACLSAARRTTAVVGVAGTALALALAASGARTLYDVFLEILGLFGGTLSGLFALGIFTRRAHGAGALVGAAAGAGAVCWLKFASAASFFLFAPAGTVVTVAVGYGVSLMLPARPRDLSGLTIHTPAIDGEPQPPPLSAVRPG
jgi:SSS family transporter